MSYRTHRTYTDGFDITWNPKKLQENYEIKHYKMHGSIIWHENTKTKECVKIPVRAFSDDGKPVRLKLIYGEDVKPLLIYPAQKAEYVEPLTDLQLMFKRRLFSPNTKILVVVGYSFRDEYRIHILWDAARANENLHVILIAPNAGEIFKNKLMFIDKDAKSRIHDRVICLQSFFCGHSELKYKYTVDLLKLCDYGKPNFVDDYEFEHRSVLELAIDCEFLSKAESQLKRLGEDFFGKEQGDLGSRNRLRYAIKGLLSSVIASDGY